MTYCRSNDKHKQIIFLTEDSVLYFPCAYFSAVNLSQTLSRFSLPEIILYLFYKELTKELQELCYSLLRSVSPLATPLMLYIPPGSTVDIWQVLQNDRDCSPTHSQNAFGNNVLHLTGHSRWMKLEGNNVSSCSLSLLTVPCFPLTLAVYKAQYWKMSVCWFSRLASGKLAKNILWSPC